MVLPLNGFYFTFAREFRSPELCVHWRGARRWRARSRGAPPELCFFLIGGGRGRGLLLPLSGFYSIFARESNAR